MKIKNKVSLRHLLVEIGRMCNLRCKHCCKGESENIAMSDEVMDALLSNVYYIDEMTISGGEPMLYVERLRTLLDKCKEKKIKVNYFNVISNFTIQSQEFVDVFNDWIDYCTFGEENELRISNDKYHKKDIESHLKGIDVNNNINWYKSEIKPCDFIDNTYETLDYNLLIFDEGRVRNWTKEEKNKYIKIKRVNEKKVTKIPLKNTCSGDENICGYGCVYNCIRDALYLNVYGQMFLDSFVSYDTQRNCKDICICNILQENIYDAILKWNIETEKQKNHVDGQIEVKNRTYDILPLRLQTMLLNAELFARTGELDQAEEKLNEAEYVIYFINRERQKTVKEANTLLEGLGYKGKMTEEFKNNMNKLKEEEPEIYSEIQEFLKSSVSFDNFLNDATKKIGAIRNIRPGAMI